MSIAPFVLEAIQEELNYQDRKWGANKQQSLPGYMAIMKRELREASDGWCENRSGRHSALAELVQVVATGIRCLQTYGVTGCAEATNDIAHFPITVAAGTGRQIKLLAQDGVTWIHLEISMIKSVVASGVGARVETTVGTYLVLESVRDVQAMMQE